MFEVLTDDRGTVMGLVKDDGTLVEQLYYNSTGLCKSWDPSGGGNWNTHPDNAAYNLGRSEYIPFGYLGMYRDRFTGKYHTHFREYDPLHARWLSEDPAGYADGLNLYNAYMGVNGIDPLGLGLFGQLMTWVGTGGQCWPESEMAGDMMYLEEAGQGLHNLKEDAITGVVDAGATAYDTYNATRTVITGENHYTETSSMFSSGGTLDKLDAVQKAAKENGLSPTFHSQAWAYGDLFGITNYCNAYSGHSVAFNGSNLAGMNELTKMQRAREAAIGTAKAASAAATIAKGVALTKSALTRKPGEILIPKKATVYRQGTFSDESIGWKGNYVKGRQWAKENPITTKNYPKKYGLPAENTGKPDWVVGGTTKGPYTTRPAPASHNIPANSGGGLEILPKTFDDVMLDWFHMPDKGI